MAKYNFIFSEYMTHYLAVLHLVSRKKKKSCSMQIFSGRILFRQMFVSIPSDAQELFQDLCSGFFSFFSHFGSGLWEWWIILTFDGAQGLLLSLC